MEGPGCQRGSWKASKEATAVFGTKGENNFMSEDDVEKHGKMAGLGTWRSQELLKDGL